VSEAFWRPQSYVSEPVCRGSPHRTGISRLNARGYIHCLALRLSTAWLNRLRSTATCSTPLRRPCRKPGPYASAARPCETHWVPRTTTALVARTRKDSTRVLLPTCEEASIQEHGRSISPRALRTQRRPSLRSRPLDLGWGVRQPETKTVSQNRTCTSSKRIICLSLRSKLVATRVRTDRPQRTMNPCHIRMRDLWCRINAVVVSSQSVVLFRSIGTIRILIHNHDAKN
jgi:hypothetical protein